MYHPQITYYMKDGRRIVEGSDIHGSADTLLGAVEIINNAIRAVSSGYAPGVEGVGSCWVDDEHKTIWEA